eukprot:SAG31_NODE_4252_length_3417_cov_1.831826_3_plen_232_part_00
MRLTNQNSRMTDRIASQKVAGWLLQVLLHWHRLCQVATSANAVRHHWKQYYGCTASAKCRLQRSIDIWRCRSAFIALKMHCVKIKSKRQAERAENAEQLALKLKESLLENLQVRSNLADQRERVVQRTMLRWIRRQLANMFCAWCRHVFSVTSCWVHQARANTALWVDLSRNAALLNLMFISGRESASTSPSTRDYEHYMCKGCLGTLATDGAVENCQASHEHHPSTKGKA